MAEDWLKRNRADSRPASPRDPLDDEEQWDIGARAATPRGVKGGDVPPPLQKPKRSEWDVEADLRGQRSAKRAQRPDPSDEEFKPGWKRRLAAGALAGAAGYARSGGRVRVRDTKSATDRLMRPGYAKAQRRWENEMGELDDQVADAQWAAEQAEARKSAKIDQMRAEAAKTQADATMRRARAAEKAASRPAPKRPPTVVSPGQEIRDPETGAMRGERSAPKAPPAQKPLEKAQETMLSGDATPEEKARAKELIKLMDPQRPTPSADRSAQKSRVEAGAMTERGKVEQQRTAALADFNLKVAAGEAGELEYGTPEYKVQLDNLNAGFNQRIEVIEESAAKQIRLLSGDIEGTEWVNKYRQPK